MKNLANVIRMEEFSKGNDIITHFKINGETVGSFAATPLNLAKTLWKVEMAYWEEGHIEIIDAFKNIEGGYKKYLKNYIDKFIWLINIAHKSDKDIHKKVDSLIETLEERRHALLNNNKKRYYDISKITYKVGRTFYSVKPIK